jgi:hypothetical protein
MRALLFTAILLLSTTALASPPPPDSEEANNLKQFSDWFQKQRGPLGNCCSIADGRTVRVKTDGNSYWVQFIHPDSIEKPTPYSGETTDVLQHSIPHAGVWYKVSNKAIIKTFNPTGYAIAWWSNYELSTNGVSLGHIRCFINMNEY